MSAVAPLHSRVLRDLLEDHELIRRYLRLLERAVAADVVAHADADLLERLRRFVEDFIDAVHHVKEDVIFFHEVVARHVAPESRLQETLDEHEVGFLHADGMRMAILDRRPGWRTAYAWNAMGLVRTIRHHLEREESDLFPAFDAAIGVSFDEIVTAQIERKLGDVDVARKESRDELIDLARILRIEEEREGEER
ncbi:MAG: hemerythrin domain-containing protein [Planctomycetota bacterium]